MGFMLNDIQIISARVYIKIIFMNGKIIIPAKQDVFIRFQHLFTFNLLIP